jgi:saccharopine dehydrogenase-like NADP-dependent oxidoreductase
MRIVVLGGAGEMGGAVSADLAACREVSELVVADIDAVKAERLVAGFGTSRARAVGLDVADRGAALELLEAADVLVNCTSFTMFDSVIELAVRQGSTTRTSSPSRATLSGRRSRRPASPPSPGSAPPRG